MKEKDSTVCPWCQTEIVWDEEIGPEEFCPNCFNELSDYRSLHVRLDGDELELTDDSGPVVSEEDLSEIGIYGFSVRQRLERQEEQMECPRCREEMVLAGKHRIEEHHYTPLVHEIGPAFLQAPFEVNLFVCPSCFSIHYALSDEDRLRLIQEWSKREEPQEHS